MTTPLRDEETGEPIVLMAFDCNVCNGRPDVSCGACGHNAGQPRPAPAHVPLKAIPLEVVDCTIAKPVAASSPLASLVQPPPLPTASGLDVWGVVIAEAEADPMFARLADPSWAAMVADMRERDAVGRARYGAPLRADNGRDQLRDAYDETLDAVAYLRSAMLAGGDVGKLQSLYDDALTLCRGVRWVIDQRVISPGAGPGDTPVEGAIEP